MQQGLITTCSSLIGVTTDPEVLILIHRQLVATQSSTFNRLRQNADLIHADISAKLSIGRKQTEDYTTNSSWQEFLIETGATARARALSSATDYQLRLQLSKEVARDGNSGTSTPVASTGNSTPALVGGRSKVSHLRVNWHKFESEQREAIEEMIGASASDDQLWINQSPPMMQEL
jgi:hypothetical protein